jgi:hypothetical protein
MGYIPRFACSEEEIYQEKAEKLNDGPSPYVLRFQGFGETKNNQWRYNYKPHNVYHSGTAQGGVWVTPPESVIDNLSDLSLSQANFLLHDDVSLAWGEPKSDGTVQDGPKIETQGSSGSRDVKISFSNATGVSRDGIIELNGLFHGKERSGVPSCTDGFFTLYIDTADSHAKIAWNDGGTARSLDLGQVT